ncbi:hypothetical protein [Amphritea balenae]|uniref:Uncharacterized protein n=1 Tax=Amphritea balenae TaxID=452629 RepID=A0A3P1SLE7_9GAMM|nr:hypothetical protein [Amphritea balenae]RRC97102.1 hypothetical protein EHS89_19320 [Amphritea balenae]GGK68031.1 hypothetical protein GCM10007941_17720 [Amphritea balenae]
MTRLANQRSYQQTNQSRLAAENKKFQGSGGVSVGNVSAGFIPAFMDPVSGRIELSRYPDGRQAPFHMLDGLPDEWIIRRNLAGHVEEIRCAIVSGFVRLGRFFTRQEAADFISKLDA